MPRHKGPIDEAKVREALKTEGIETIDDLVKKSVKESKDKVKGGDPEAMWGVLYDSEKWALILR